MASLASCSSTPRALNSNSTGPAFQLPNGRYLDACLIFKAGWTEWHELLLRGTHAKPEPSSYQPYAHAPLVPRFAYDAASACHVTRIILVRNPYERLLSYYLDKIVASCNHGPHPKPQCSKSGYWPVGLPLNASFSQTIHHITKPDAKFGSRLGELHYAPIATTYSWCLRNGRVEDRRVLKLERVDGWYAPLVAELGLREVASSGWKTGNAGGCFYVPRGKSCATALEIPSTADTSSSSSSEGGGGNASATRTTTMRHNRGARDKLLEYYDAATAKLVTLHYKADLEAFGYAEWDGQSEYRPWEDL